MQNKGKIKIFLSLITICLLTFSYDVFALNITPSTCHLYYTAGNKVGTINNYNSNGQQWFGCQGSGITDSLTGTRYYYANINHGKDGFGLVTFSIQAQSKTQVSHAVFTTGGVDYSCSVSTGSQLTESSDGLRTYYVACNNVVLVPTQNFFIRLYTNSNSIGQLGSYIQTGVNFYSSQDIADSIVDGIQGEDKPQTPVDDSKVNDYESKEEGLINQDSLDEIDNIEVAIDSNANLFIWNIIENILNTHELIFGMIITLLSIGVIKLILNR